MKQKQIERSQLSRFVGRWNTEVTVRATENAPAVEVRGTDIYEWLPGGVGIPPGIKVPDLGCADGTTAIPAAKLGAAAEARWPKW